jgi:hypothetical protein
MTPRKYELLLTRSQKFMLVVPILALVILPLLFFVVFFQGLIPNSRHPADIPAFFPWFPFGMFFLLAGWLIWIMLTTPREIIVTADRKLVFKSVLRSREVRPSDVVSIEPKTLRVQINMSGYQLVHLNGKIAYPGQFTGMYQLLTELKLANPSVEIKGC